MRRLAYNLTKAEEAAHSKADLPQTFEQFTKVRKAHVEQVLDMGNRAGDASREMGPIAETLM